MNGSMRNRRLPVLFFTFLVITSCNMPAAYQQEQLPKPDEFIWDLYSSQNNNIFTEPDPQPLGSAKTPTPQLIKEIDFEQAFSNTSPVIRSASSDPVSSNPNGSDNTKWLYFDPVEYSSQSMDTLYAAFENTGTSTWDETYYLEFYAGANPSSATKIPLSGIVLPGSQAQFQIPIKTEASSWKSCWQLNNSEHVSFYEFCYNHGDGKNSIPAVQNASADNEQSEIFYAFRRTKGSAPSRYSTAELSAEYIATNPQTGHTFKAYDHSETLTVSFKNTGSETWDSSYSLVFYNGYNWMHANSFSLPNSTGPEETAVFTLPMEIFEDNDKWVTCWYLSTPDGKNLADFCFNYYTKS